MKSVFGLIGAAIPVLYCGGLLVYFAGVEKWTGVPVGEALNPTMLGLGAIGLLFLILFVLKVLRLFGGKGAPGAGGGRTDAAPKEDERAFDPDAAIARYMARRSSGAGDPASPQEGGGPARRTGFGRRGV
ncbi:MAG: hypothetical protein QOD42_3217 [Sphingomonadales bacterium]|jgi:hypothetical protein|nr:hypothetical protein [Sphingomonadales bacterium]